MKRLLLALVVALLPAVGWGQATVLQGGSFTPGLLPTYSISGGSQPIVQQSGPASGTGVGIKELSIIARGTGTAPFAAQGSGPLGTINCTQDGPSTSAAGYHYLCLSANAQGGGLIAYGAAGGASNLPLQLYVNGSYFTLPGSASCLGCGSMAGQNADNVSISGGTVVGLSNFRVGAAQSSIGQIAQVTAAYSNVNASQDSLRVQLGNFNINDELSGTTNGSYSNWAIVGATRIPAGGFGGLSQWPSGGVAGYAISDNPAIPAVGMYGASGISASGSGTVSTGANFVTTNTTIQSGLANSGQNFDVMYGMESNTVIKAKAGGIAPIGNYAAGVSAILNADINPTVNALAGLLVSTINLPWGFGLVTLNGAASVGAQFGSIATTGPTNSQSIRIQGLDGANVGYLGQLYVVPGTGVVIENTTLGSQFIVGNPSGVTGTLINNSSGNPNILQILNNTVNAATSASLSMATGTANSFFNLQVTDAGTALISVGSGVAGGLAINTSGMSVSSSVSTSVSFLVQPLIALTAGGSTSMALKLGTASIGIFPGTGAPTITAAQGSVYLRQNGVPYFNVAGSTGWAPVSATAVNVQTGATYTVVDSDTDIVANRAGTITVTLPNAATYQNRCIHFLTIQNQTVVSASSNVSPLAGGAAGTAILAGTAGKWARLCSDAANWQIMAAN